jgi:hypothetical protein
LEASVRHEEQHGAVAVLDDLGLPNQRGDDGRLSGLRTVTRERGDEE